MASRMFLAVAIILLLVQRSVAAHDGPPFPIVSNQIAGPYSISIWTDPDTTDDGTPAGQFWVTLEAARGAGAMPAGTIATVSVAPLDRTGQTYEGKAAPVDGKINRQFVALLLDHEGRFAVRVTVEGPLGRANVDSQVDATYDLRPSPASVVLYLLPFVAVGVLWVKVLIQRRRTAPRDAGSLQSRDHR